MERSDYQYAQARLAQLQGQYKVEVVPDWSEEGEAWNPGTWTRPELDKLNQSIAALAELMGGAGSFIHQLDGVTVRKADIGTHGGEALSHRVSLSKQGTFTSWTVVHELAHAWDGNYNWRLSRQLERYTGGFTNPLFSLLKRTAGMSDSGRFGPENKPGRYGRKPGCNRAGYFYGDKPSGSNWSFNRKEDFAESVAMYVGWGRGNDLSEWADARIKRYLLANGAADRNFGVDNWADYARYFYPENGDYTRTRRWQFVDELIHGRIVIG